MFYDALLTRVLGYGKLWNNTVMSRCRGQNCSGHIFWVVECLTFILDSVPLDLDMKKAPIAGRLSYIQLFPIM